MNKIIRVAPFFLTLGLFGCSAESDVPSQKDGQSAEALETADNKEKIDAQVSDFGDVTAVYFDNDVKLTKGFSAVNVTINNIKMFDLKVDDMYENQMEIKQDVSHVIVLKFTAENTTNRKIGFRPEVDSKIVVNNKQSNASFFDAPGEIMPKAAADFELHYEFKDSLEDVNKFTIYFEPAFDSETSESIGESTEWAIKLNNK